MNVATYASMFAETFSLSAVQENGSADQCACILPSIWLTIKKTWR